MIPGTTLAPGGGGALSRDVGGSGNLQQSPLQYRGSGDTVQTIEGIRLNNLCAQGASRRLLERRSFEEFSYVTGADRPKWARAACASTWCRATAATRSAVRRCSTTPTRVSIRQLRLAGHRPGLHALEPERQQDVQSQQPHHQRRRHQEDLGRQSDDRRTDPQEQGLVQLLVPAPRLDEDQDGRLLRQEPVAVRLRPGLHQAGHRRRPHRQQRGRISWQVSGKDKISVYHDNQRKYNHWGIAANIPPEAAGVQVTPTSFVNVSKWTRTHTNKLLLEAGFGCTTRNTPSSISRA